MSLQIIGGRFKNFKLFVWNSSKLRPTSVMLRRKVFDAHQNLDHFIFVDCFAGTGSVGIEALSRGVGLVYFNEFNLTIFKNLKKNIENLCEKFEFNADQLILEKSDIKKFNQKFKRYYQSLSKTFQENTILFWDPPYEQHDLYSVLLDDYDLSWYNGKVWIESDLQKGPSKSSILNNQLELCKEYKASDQYIMICKFKESCFK